MTPRRLALASAFVFAGIAAAAAAPIAPPLVLENDAAWSEVATPRRCYYTYYRKTVGFPHRQALLLQAPLLRRPPPLAPVKPEHQSGAIRLTAGGAAPPARGKLAVMDGTRPLPDVNRDYDAALAVFTAWYVYEAPRLRSPRQLVRETCERFVAHGVPLSRFVALLLMLHPDHFGVSHRWFRGNPEIKTSRGNYAIWNSPVLQDSPYGEIYRGAAALRRRLVGPQAQIDFAVLKEYVADGCTDYVIMHLPFSDEGRHAAAFATDRPEGFTPAELAFIDAMLPHLARQSELLTLRYLTTTLLDTYVGRKAGERVLTGQIRRGSGETIRAVIWLSDLRGFTTLSDRLPRDSLIALLNGYFDCVGGAIDAAGGEILKFIGDAVLAIFPLGERYDLAVTARAAVGAAQKARAGLAELRKLPGGETLDFGVALHVGDVMYGNIGTSQRLDFTVIGPAVNMTARLESLAGSLGEPIVVSAEIAKALGSGLESIGRHSLKGMAAPVEAFRPARV